MLKNTAHTLVIIFALIIIVPLAISMGYDGYHIKQFHTFMDKVSTTPMGNFSGRDGSQSCFVHDR